jgi:hypothetical protein
VTTLIFGATKAALSTGLALAGWALKPFMICFIDVLVKHYGVLMKQIGTPFLTRRSLKQSPTANFYGWHRICFLLFDNRGSAVLNLET